MNNKFLALLGLAFLLSFGSLQAKEQIGCELDNAALRAMPEVQVTLTASSGKEHTVTARLADNNQTRAAGFQRVCASVIAAMPILFEFKVPRVPRFHMHNVVAPIDIAFILPDNGIDSIQAMQPYSLIQIDKPLYQPSQPSIAALEAYPGFFLERQIDTAAKITWRSNKSD